MHWKLWQSLYSRATLSTILKLWGAVAGLQNDLSTTLGIVLVCQKKGCQNTEHSVVMHQNDYKCNFQTIIFDYVIL